MATKAADNSEKKKRGPRGLRGEASVSGKKTRIPQAQRRDESVKRIIAASMELLATNGYQRFSLVDVGKKAGCSYELVNHYFGNKNGLVEAIVDHIMASLGNSMLGNIEANMSTMPTGFDRLTLTIQLLTAPADRHSPEFVGYRRLSGEAPYDPMLSELFRKRRQHTLQIIMAAIAEGQRAKEIRADIEAEGFAAMIYEFVRGHADVSALVAGHTSADVKTQNATPLSIGLFIESLRHILSPRPINVNLAVTK